MERIYKNQYLTDNLNEITATLAVTAPEIERILLSHPFFSKQPIDREEMFLNLALACNHLAVCEDAEIEITLESGKSTATILLTAPCFVFQCRELALWQKLCLLSSEITIEPNTKIIVVFDFSKANDTFYGCLKEQA